MVIEQSLRRWKCVAILAMGSAAALLAALLATIFVRPGRLVDERLIGTWQSDADRTIAGIRERRPVDEKQEAGLRQLFGKLRLTYSDSNISVDLDGEQKVQPFQVLGRDRHSVVIRSKVPAAPPTMVNALQMSEFDVLHFDGEDSYWVYDNLGGTREYFKRVR